MLSTLSDGSIAVFDRYSGAVRLFSDELCSEPEYAWDGIISRPFRPCFLSDLLWVPSIVRRTQSIPIFDFQVPTELPGVDSKILDPRDTYANAADWDVKAKDLAGRFIKNFTKFTGNEEGKSLVAAGPKL